MTAAAVRIRGDDDDARPGRRHGSEQAEVLVRRRDDLVVRVEAKAPEDDPAAVRGRRRESDDIGLGADEPCERFPQLLAERKRFLERGLSRAAVLQVPLDAALECLGHRPRERPERPRVEVRDRLEHRKQRPGLLEGHSSTSTVASTTGWSESTTPLCRRRSPGQTVTDVVAAPRTSTWSIPSTGRE